MTMTRFKIPGKPVGKQRPRTFQQNGYTRTITPQKTKDYEFLVRMCYNRFAGGIVFEGAIRVDVFVSVAPPASWSKKKREQALQGEILPTVKPDLDNIAKTILDALNGYAYKDDSQVCSLTVRKQYGAEDFVSVCIGDTVLNP